MTWHAQLCYKHYDPSKDQMAIALHSVGDLENPPRIVVEGAFVTIYIASDMFFLTKDTFYDLVVEEEQDGTDE